METVYLMAKGICLSILPTTFLFNGKSRGQRGSYLSRRKGLLAVTFPVYFFTFGCQEIKQSVTNDKVARFGMDRDFPNLNYTGDGNFTDRGRQSGIRRFGLDLGAVDLKEASVKIYVLEGLPEVEFVSYLRIEHPLPVSGKPENFSAGGVTVEISLDDSNGRGIFSEKAPLKNWTWSGSVGASQSDLYTPKTIFIPESGKPYRLTLKIAEGNLQAPKCRLLFIGGGWKSFD